VADEYRTVRIEAAAAVVRLTLSSGRPVLKPDNPAFAAFAKALDEYRRSLEVENDLPDVMVERGSLELFAGQLAAATKAYRQALRYNDKLADAYVGLALVSLAQNDRQEAFKQAKRAFDISGKEAHGRLVNQLRQGPR
jgi:tetratricopeptide (TPR) repeat protein